MNCEDDFERELDEECEDMMLEAADLLNKEAKENSMRVITRDEAIDIITDSARVGNKILQEIINLLEVQPNDDIRIIDFKLSILKVIKDNIGPFNKEHGASDHNP